jgi:hypothetical protein
MKSKKRWATPIVKVHGTIEEITRQTKSLGTADGVIFDIDGNGPIPGVPIGPFS